MKNSTQINGLPIISILDGNTIGKVKSLVINPDKGSVDFLTIEHEDWQVSVKAIPFKKVIGIGEYAVTVDSESAVIDLNEIPIANQLVNKKIKMVNTKVMTRKGELLGESIEYYLDDESGNILGMQLKVGNEEVALPADAVVTYGKDIIIVKEDAASQFLNTPAELEISQSINEDIEVDSEKKDEVKALKEKQIELMQGKKALKDIVDRNGQVIIPAGTMLTAADIERVQTEGPSFVVELSMNVE